MKIIERYILPVLLVFLLQSCFTGVEGTSKITLSKKDIEETNAEKETNILAQLRSYPLSQWEKGKKFIVADEKIGLIIEGKSAVTLHPGDTVIYLGSEARTSAGGGERTILRFQNREEQFEYPVDKTLKVAAETVVSDEVPMLIDISTVREAARLLEGNSYWTKSTLWYDESGEYKKGRKFEPVTIEEVKPGNAFFPLIVKFKDGLGNSGAYYMNLGRKNNDNRTFGRLFSLTDPHERYKHIDADNWKAIQNEEVRTGMTKEEVRLSKGNPKDVETGHNYSNTMEIWYYPDGKYFRFLDGLLIGNP